MGSLTLQESNFRELDVDGRLLLFHAPSAGLFEVDPAGVRILERLRERRELVEEELLDGFDDSVERAHIREALAEFRALGIVTGKTLSYGAARGREKIREFPLSTLALNVTTGCNLSCTYCYKDDLAPRAHAKRMNFEIARKSVELLLERGKSRPRLNLVFFGGEPLSDLPLIRHVVDYAEKRAAECGGRIDFSLTTNATLLDEASVEYFDSHRFGLSVSIDGPKAVHDRNRKTVGGAGTYDVVARKARMLLERYKSRPVGARVTLTAGLPDVETIFDHLKSGLGFAEVGLAPVTAADSASFGLSEADLAHMLSGMMRLGERYEQAALRNEYLGFSNLHHLIADLHQGTRKALPCGAGIALLAVDHEGKLNLCHRFSGSGLPAFGDVDKGIDKAQLGALLERARDLSREDCETCHIRMLCRGGCYHERYRRYGNPLHPAYHYCNLMREWVDFAIAIYSRIAAANPAFFEDHIARDSERYVDLRGVWP